MTEMEQLQKRVLADRKISRDEVAIIQKFLVSDGHLDFQDIHLLVELATQADKVCPEFDEILFPCLRSVILEDGVVTREEQVLLMKLFSTRELRACELQFLAGLYDDVRAITPELQAVFESVLGTVPS